jgi:hypothetical protein
VEHGVDQLHSSLNSRWPWTPCLLQGDLTDLQPPGHKAPAVPDVIKKLQRRQGGGAVYKVGHTMMKKVKRPQTPPHPTPPAAPGAP